ncbi:MAG TPA: glycosyltransferase family 4 protein [Ignavibacteria bacterium]|jgi:glycosyltransferase involved in cell wall biosynthesis
MEKLRVFLLNASAIYGGGEFYVLQLAGELKKRGHFVIVGCRKDSLLFEKCITENISAEPIDFRENGTKGLAGNVRKIKQIALANSIQIIHTNTGIDRTAGAIAAKLAGVQHVSSCHSLISVQHNVTHWLRNNYLTGAFIADGETIKNLLVNIHNIDKNKVEVINNGISPDEMIKDPQAGAEFRNEFGIGNNEIVIGNVARLVYFKGHRYLLNAFAAIKQEYENIKLIIVGDGELINELKEYSVTLKISNSVIFTGFREDLKKIYSSFDIYVHPSVEGGGELFPFTLLYAMAVSLPVIATDIGDMPFIIENEKNGFIVKEKSDFELSEKLKLLIKSPELRKKLGNEAFLKFSQKYTTNKMVDKTEELYCKLL